ncbi:MAG TPA: sigma-70 family RNA polymerase sigma factor, partial [Planctomycetota bacterium]
MNPSDARIEHLLQEAGWLRCLARNLVDPSRVDDVVQDTWLAALRKGPGLDGGMQHGGMRPWLGRVARNLASNLRRDERRRRQRDAAARAEPAEATPDDLAQAAELQRLLATAIERLPESMRDVIVLAYFHGLDSRQIGQRLGLSPSAVRTRHQRAIEELRKSLDSSSSRREAWLAMAVRFLGNSEGAIVRRSAAWLAWSCAAVTVAATATAHLAGWLPGSAADTPAIAPVAVTAPPATTPAPDPAGTLRTAAAPEAAVTPSPSTPPAAPATAAITGRLLVDGGLPAWELRLRLVDEPDPTALPEPAGNVLRERRAPRRDELLPVAARGAFRFEGLPAGWRGVLLVEGCTALDGGPSVPIASPSVDLLVALRAGPRLSGRVQLPDNGPVASEGLCEVRTGPAGEPATRSMVLRFRTAADGEFSLPILTKAEQVSAVIRLEVDGRGFPHHETARLDARTSHDLGRLAATPVRDLQVLVVDRAGQPLAGASVQVDGAGQACREVTTDANGACTLRFVPARLCSLRVNAAM